MDKILEVKNLKISFRTQNGTLKAVRNISFDLERGKTLAIVGESGSGKSVTSKAILGILAGNSITEGGEILFDGMDLLKIPEDEMCRIRGDRISMIFQDPLSALNPVVRIGRQITEAMLLKNRGTRRAGRRDFNDTLALLKKNMIDAKAAPESKINEMCKTFDNFCIEAIRLENNYDLALGAAEGMAKDITDFVFMAENNQKQNVKEELAEILKELKELKDPLLTHKYDERLAKYPPIISRFRAGYREGKKGAVTPIASDFLDTLKELGGVLKEIIDETRVNFFRVGYFKMKNPNEDLTKYDVAELNAKALEFLNRDFMNEFVGYAEKGIEYSATTALAVKKDVLPKLRTAREFYLGDFTKAEAEAKAKEIAAEVEKSIDRLEVNKDSVAYTFKTGLLSEINKYFNAQKKNPKEEARFAKQSVKREKLVAKGKTVDWQVIPKNVYDLDELKQDIVSVFDRMIENYETRIADAANIDYHARAVAMIDFFRDKASQVVYKVTKRMAKEKAIELMEEVGIPEPRTRFRQYPFEFSGGMRQRIVIAIALAADPEILICDEPTTALDVTIQAQILELINNLKDERKLSVIFITHDLGVVANMADDIAVMYAGKIVEYGTADDIFYEPRHPYTWALLSSMPDLDTKEKLDAIPGTPPNMIYPPKGDAFADRNKYALKIDFEMEPPQFRVSDTHWAATWLLHPDAPKIDPPKAIVDRIERMKKAGGETA